MRVTAAAWWEGGGGLTAGWEEGRHLRHLVHELRQRRPCRVPVKDVLRSIIPFTYLPLAPLALLALLALLVFVVALALALALARPLARRRARAHVRLNKVADGNIARLHTVVLCVTACVATGE